MNSSLVPRHRSEAGIALPMTLIVMSLITSLTVALLAFTSSEPVIASNQMANAQARAIAESGVERALWALSKGVTDPTANGALSDPLPTPVPSPYNGDNPATATYVSVGVGEFRVLVASGAVPSERTITAVGYVPNHDRPIAIKKIQTTVTHIPSPPPPPCAVCASGGPSTTIRIGGSASISASTAQGAQYCAGFTPTSAAYSSGSIDTNGNPNLTGPTGGSAIAVGQTNFSFMSTDPSSIMYVAPDGTMPNWAAIKAAAQANGTYYKGNQTWTSPPPNGIIVVDTPSGNILTSSSPSSDFISVDIHGNWSSGWSGWLIVNGSIQISGSTRLTGLIYAQNDVSLHGTGGGSISGAVVSANAVDTQSTNIDTDDTGNAPVTYNCPAVEDGAGTIPRNWFVKPGSYREVSGT